MLNKTLHLHEKIFDPDLAQKSTREGYGVGVVEAGTLNKDVVVLTADLGESTHSASFGHKFPDRYIDVGVAEQNLAGVSAGLALSGKIPFMASYAVFSPGRNWDQIRVSICYSNANVKIVSSHTGLSAGPDGATHQALEDIALMRVLPNMTVVYPSDFEEARKATLALATLKGPAYLRLARTASPTYTTSETPFELGKANILHEGKDITVITAGPITYTVLQIAQQLEPKISVEVINMHTIKPLDEMAIIKSARKTQRVLVVEEHQVAGGLGGAVCELLSEKYPTKIKRLGVQDTFGESGSYLDLLDKYGLSGKAIETEIKNLL